MIDVNAEIERTERRVSLSKTPSTELRIAWIKALNQLDHCDDIRTALDSLCSHLINRFCKKGTTKTELLKPYLDQIERTKKELGHYESAN